MDILTAIRDRKLFRPFLGEDLSSWQSWQTALAVLYGLPVLGSTARQLVRQCTGRKCTQLPKEGFSTALLLTGRRSGKSRIAAAIAAFEAVLSGREKLLAPGELGLVLVVSPTKNQSRIVFHYLKAIFSTPLLQPEVVAETASGFELRNGVRIEIGTGEGKLVRGFTLLAAVVDELAFFGISEESKVKSDTELVRALLPGLATTQGRLIAISSPYARRGQCWKWFQKHHANNNGTVLVWNCASRVMNPTLAQHIIDAAYAEDLAAAKSEFGGEFRDDISLFLPREVVESAVIPGRIELMPRAGTEYAGFADVSGGRSDDATLAIGHRAASKVVVDKLVVFHSPFDPSVVISQMCQELRKFGCRVVTGDNYAAEFSRRAFVANRVGYRKSEKPKSKLYLEFLPRLCSSGVELLDDPRLIDQIAGLERRTRSGGADIVDHAPGNHDDMANVVAGLVDVLSKPSIRVGGGFNTAAEQSRDGEILQRRAAVAGLMGMNAGQGQRYGISRF